MPFFQPECITQILRRLGYVLFARLTLRLIGLMTNPTVRGGFLLLLVFPRNRNKPCGPICSERRRIATDYLEVCFVWKMNCKLAGAIPSWTCSISHVAKTRKQESHGITRRYCDVAIRTNLWRRSLACEELLPVAIETRLMLRKLGHIRKSRVAFANFFPVSTWETCGTNHMSTFVW